MPVIHAQDAPTFDVGNALITGLAAPSRGATDTAAWRVRLHAGAPSPRHALDREVTVAAGGALIVPAGQAFSLLARDGDAEAVCVLPVGGTAAVDGGEPFTPPWAA